MAKENKIALKATLVQLICIVVFLIVLKLANFINISNPIYSQIVGFLNQNLGIIIIFSFSLYFGELFFVFKFPLNLIVPVFNATGAVFLEVFLFRVFYLIGEVAKEEAFLKFKFLELWALMLVPVIILIVGYVKIIKYNNKEARNKKIELEEPKKEQTEEPKKSRRKNSS